MVTFGELRCRGVRTAFVSSSIGQFADWLAGRLRVAHSVANPLLAGPDGRLTGGIELAVPGAGKAAVLRALRESLGTAREEVLAVGDSDLDIGLFEEAGTCCAVRDAPEAVRDAATHVLGSGSLAGVLDLLGGGA